MILVVPTREEHLAGFHAVLDAVARERRYIGLTEAPPLEQASEFVRELLRSGGVQVVAVTPAGAVVGWCDVSRQPLDGFRHVGRLGMGVLPEYRRRGIGRQLAVGAIRAARDSGIERIELDVFASNTGAIRLYERLGFEREGVKHAARKLDGRREDIVLMALLGAAQG